MYQLTYFTDDWGEGSRKGKREMGCIWRAEASLPTAHSKGTRKWRSITQEIVTLWFSLFSSSWPACPCSALQGPGALSGWAEQTYQLALPWWKEFFCVCQDIGSTTVLSLAINRSWRHAKLNSGEHCIFSHTYIRLMWVEENIPAHSVPQSVQGPAQPVQCYQQAHPSGLTCRQRSSGVFYQVFSIK